MQATDRQPIAISVVIILLTVPILFFLSRGMSSSMMKKVTNIPTATKKGISGCSLYLPATSIAVPITVRSPNIM